MLFTTCIKCNEPFTDKNVFTPAGWKEIQISGYCEKCYDEIFPDHDDIDFNTDQKLEPL